MSCSAPASWEDLVAYWAGDLSSDAVDRLEGHLLDCGVCSAESGRMAAIVGALRDYVPPVVSRAMVEGLRARGLRIEENEFVPEQRRGVVFASGVDLLIHRLTGFDLSNARQVQVTVRVESTGVVLSEDTNAPFDLREGVLIACRRRYAGLPPDTVFEVRATDQGGSERTAVYAIPHTFQDV